MNDTTTRVRVIRAQLTDDEWRALKTHAAMSGRTLQDFASVLLRQGADVASLPAELADAIERQYRRTWGHES